MRKHPTVDEFFPRFIDQCLEMLYFQHRFLPHLLILENVRNPAELNNLSLIKGESTIPALMGLLRY